MKEWAVGKGGIFRSFLCDFESIGFSVFRRTGTITKHLWSHGADVNQANYEGDNPLLVSSQKGNHEVVKLLLAKGADVNLSA